MKFSRIISGPSHEVSSQIINKGLGAALSLKSVNLQNIMLGCMDNGTNELVLKCLMFQVLFYFIFFIDLGHSKLFLFIFVNL